MPPGVSAAIFVFQSLRYHDIIKELYPFYIHNVLCKMLLLRMESGTQIYLMITLESDLVVLAIHVNFISLDVVFLLV